MSLHVLFYTRLGPMFEGPFNNKGSVFLEYQCWGNKTRLQPWGMPCKTHLTSYHNQSSLVVRDTITDPLFVNEWSLVRHLNSPSWASVQWNFHIINQMTWPIRWARWRNTIDEVSNNNSYILMQVFGLAGTHTSELPWRFGGLLGNAKFTDDLKIVMNGVVSGVEANVPINQGDSASIVNNKIMAALTQLGIPDLSYDSSNNIISFNKMPIGENCEKLEIHDNIAGIEFQFANRMKYNDEFILQPGNHP